MSDLVDQEAQLDGRAGAAGQRSASTEHAAPSRAKTADQLIRQTRRLADDLAARPNLGMKAAPRWELERLAELGLLLCPFPEALGGLGIGVAPGTQATMLRLLSLIGGADLALGRLVEGHWNALLLVLRYGTREQIQQLAADVTAGALCGVWNTGEPKVMQVHPDGDGFRLEGAKTFATGAAFVTRPIVTADLPGQGWQMTMPRMETLQVSIDRSFWHPLGMESSESFGVDFSGNRLAATDLIGRPGDFYRDPMFRGGAVRFAAVQAGAIVRLHALFAAWLETMRRGEDPYQVARLGEIAIAAQEAVLWVEKAAAVAEECFYQEEQEYTWRMLECANMMRTAIERQSSRVMALVTAGVGAHGLLQPQPFERVLRDLTMYLRQPAPDQTLAAVGTASLAKQHWREGGTSWGFWSDDQISHSLPAEYFRNIYRRKSDPWDFASSRYEQDKYQATLKSLQRPVYKRGLEVGCSIGVLTSRLAQRTENLLGLDVTSAALDQARERNAENAHVSFVCMQVPQDFPDGRFDLIVISEVAYYWRMADLVKAVDGLAQRSEPGGNLVLVHLTEFVPDYPLRGDQVHDYWLSRPEWKSVHSERHARFRLDVLEKL